MHEELLSNRESLLPTHHEKIMRAETPGTLTEADLLAIGELANQKGNHAGTRNLLSQLVPEYEG
jgi:FlaA1/EpsC-like NDP-sugar epimerase